MIQSNQVTPGMVIEIDTELYRVESNVKVTLPKGDPFMKTRLVNLRTHKTIEKNFKIAQQLEDVKLKKASLEFLYVEGNEFLFLDIDILDQIKIPEAVVGEQVNFLKEGVIVEASIYGDQVFTLDLPQFLELMITDVETGVDHEVGGSKKAILETGAHVSIPPFIETGDIIKIDTRTQEYIQRV